MFEKGEPQFLGREETPKNKEAPRETSFKNPEEAVRELKEKGVRKEDIEATLGLEKRISFLDRKIFPENPADINFALKRKSKDFAGFIIPEKDDDKERSYQIVVKGLARFLEKERNEEVAIFGLDGKCKNEKQYSLEFLIAAHEVRHRVQRDKGIKQFSPEDAKLVKDQLLSNIIKFCEILFKEREKNYRKENKPEEFIRKKLSPKEFDAMVIERFIGNKLNEIPKRLGAGMEIGDLHEFISIIQMAAPEKDKLEK